MFSQILAAIAAIPQLLSAIQELVAMFKKADEEKWFARQSVIFNTQLPKAETKQEFEDAAKAIQDQIKNL